MLYSKNLTVFTVFVDFLKGFWLVSALKPNLGSMNPIWSKKSFIIFFLAAAQSV